MSSETGSTTLSGGDTSKGLVTISTGKVKGTAGFKSSCRTFRAFLLPAADTAASAVAGRALCTGATGICALDLKIDTERYVLTGELDKREDTAGLYGVIDITGLNSAVACRDFKLVWFSAGRGALGGFGAGLNGETGSVLYLYKL